jgi:hypothetical protein
MEMNIEEINQEIFLLENQSKKKLNIEIIL